MPVVAPVTCPAVRGVRVLLHRSGVPVLIKHGRVDRRSGVAGDVGVPMLHVAQGKESKKVQCNVVCELVVGSVGDVSKCYGGGC